MPRWHGLNHFEEALSVSYTDGQKFEDLSKVCVNQSDNHVHWHRQVVVFACHDVLTCEDCKDGYILLCCLQAYIEFDLYTAFEVHTMHTLTSGQEALSMLNTLIQVNFIYILIFMLTSVLGRHTPRRRNRDLKRIENHLSMHVFDDIEAKGVTRNFNTKPNKKMHGPLKETYQLRTNFKDVADQVRQFNIVHLIINTHCSIASPHWSLSISGRAYPLQDRRLQHILQLNSWRNWQWRWWTEHGELLSHQVR